MKPIEMFSLSSMVRHKIANAKSQKEIDEIVKSHKFLMKKLGK